MESYHGYSYLTKIKDTPAYGAGVCRVYWAHLPEHKDITSEGYVGITNQAMVNRVSGHKSDAERTTLNYVFHKALRKYKERIVFDVLVVGTPEYCASVEAKLRPEAFIGWNMADGGKGYGTHLSQYTSTPEFKVKRSSHMKKAWQDGGPHIEKMLAARKSYYENTPPWRRVGAHLELWKRASEIATVMEVTGWGLEKTSNYLMMEEQVRTTSLGRMIASGWNPNEDEDYLEMYPQAFADEIEDTYGSFSGYHAAYLRYGRDSTWYNADKLHRDYERELPLAQIARNNGYTYHQYYKMHYKFDKGWVPEKDPRWKKWKENLNE